MSARMVKLGILSSLLLIATWMLFRGGPELISTRSLRHAWNAGHILYFALLSYLLLQTRLLARQSGAVQWSLTLGLVLLTGGLIELSQIGTDRTPDIDDLLRDLSGGLLVLAFSSARPGRKSLRWGLIGLRLGLLVLLLYFLRPLTVSLLDEAIARARFPVLADFETPFELERWTGDALGSIHRLDAMDDAAFLHLQLTPRRYSGAHLEYFPGDWRGYESMRLTLYNPVSQALELTCRIHDAQHVQGPQRYADRFNQSYVLQPGLNEILIELQSLVEAPKARDMNLARIRGLGLFVMDIEADRSLYLLEIRLQ